MRAYFAQLPATRARADGDGGLRYNLLTSPASRILVPAGEQSWRPTRFARLQQNAKAPALKRKTVPPRECVSARNLLHPIIALYNRYRGVYNTLEYRFTFNHTVRVNFTGEFHEDVTREKALAKSLTRIPICDFALQEGKRRTNDRNNVSLSDSVRIATAKSKVHRSSPFLPCVVFGLFFFRITHGPALSTCMVRFYFIIRIIYIKTGRVSIICKVEDQSFNLQ